jgi:RimJ/RimL family protein N-acetyltransferase
MVEITTSRLLISPINISEAHLVAGLITEKICRWTAVIPWPYNITDANWWINNNIPQKRLGIYLLPAQILIGTISMPVADAEEVGFIINAKYEGKGYATEALRSVIDFVFNNSDLKFIDSAVHYENLASQRVHEKAGFKVIEYGEVFWPNKNSLIKTIKYRLYKDQS